jgi:hypothetical protein
MGSIQENLTIIEAYMNNAITARIMAKIFLFMVMEFSENIGRGASYSARGGDAISQKSWTCQNHKNSMYIHGD